MEFLTKFQNSEIFFQFIFKMGEPFYWCEHTKLYTWTYVPYATQDIREKQP